MAKSYNKTNLLNFALLVDADRIRTQPRNPLQLQLLRTLLTMPTKQINPAYNAEIAFITVASDAGVVITALVKVFVDINKKTCIKRTHILMLVNKAWDKFYVVVSVAVRFPATANT
uniref:Uncharacterized protein n=1 Tax=Glossina austeni TaxID=7395 RepID=A0A1A9UZA0_GLOAU